MDLLLWKTLGSSHKFSISPHPPPTTSKTEPRPWGLQWCLFAFFFFFTFWRLGFYLLLIFNTLTFIHFYTCVIFPVSGLVGSCLGLDSPITRGFFFLVFFFFQEIKIRAGENQGNGKKRCWSFLSSEANSALHKYALLCTCLLLLHITLSLSGGAIQIPRWHKLVQRSGSARLLSLHIPFSSSPQPSATHLGLVTHDSWSRLSKFNLRCDLGKGEKKKKSPYL